MHSCVVPYMYRPSYCNHNNYTGTGYIRVNALLISSSTKETSDNKVEKKELQSVRWIHTQVPRPFEGWIDGLGMRLRSLGQMYTAPC